ncbi:hypothetical protein Tco_0003495 [Tanacetum coccineum]
MVQSSSSALDPIVCSWPPPLQSRNNGLPRMMSSSPTILIGSMVKFLAPSTRTLHGHHIETTGATFDGFVPWRSSSLNSSTSFARYFGGDLEEEGQQFHEIFTKALPMASILNLEDNLPMLRWFCVNGLEKRMIALQNRRSAFFSTETDPEYYTDELIRNLVMYSCSDTSMEETSVKKKGKEFNFVVEASAGLSNVPPNLSPFENAFDLPNSYITGGNNALSELPLKQSWTSTFRNDYEGQVKAEQRADMMIGIELSYVPGSSDQRYPLVGAEMNYGNTGQAYGAISQTQDYTAFLNNMSGFNYDNPLSNKRSSNEEFDRELWKVQKVFVERGRELGRQEARELLMANQRLSGCDPNLPRKVKDIVRGLKRTRWECMESLISSFDLSPSLLCNVLERGDSSAGKGSSI